MFPDPEDFDGVPIPETDVSEPLDPDSVAVLGTQLVVESAVKREDSM